MKTPPEWAVPVSTKMFANGIKKRDIAKRLGCSPQWITNIMRGYKRNEDAQKAIIEAVDEIIRERAQHTA